MKAVDFQSCPKTKAKTCECSKLESITESNETIKAICQLEHSPKDVTGFIKFKQKFGKETIIKGIVKGLTPGLHGFHIHEFGDLSDGCASAGGHYNPEGVKHGGLEHGHVGDLGNINADDQGIARFQFKAPRVQLHDVVGRAIVVHADTDDLGQGGDEESTKTGNAGDRVACGVIRLKGSIEEDYNRALSDKHFNRNELPQIRRSHIKDSDFNYKEGKISIDKIKPVQSQRVDGLSKKAEDVFLNNEDRPFIVDRKGYLINGHHRFDAANVLGIKKVPAIMIDADIEDVIKTFAHTTSDAKTMAENYFNDLLQSKMEEELDEDWKNVARAGLATAALGMGVAGMPDSVAPDDFSPDKGVTTQKIRVNNGVYTVDGKEIRNVSRVEKRTPEYEKLYTKYYNQRIADYTKQGHNVTDRSAERFKPDLVSSAKRYAEVKSTVEYATKYPAPDQGKTARPHIDDYKNPSNPYDVNKFVPSSMPDRVGENFADGKVKGKSRPGRVKKAGASCDGSVTSLRKKAKNSSGERGKMYHWCANMKGGKKKS